MMRQSRRRWIPWLVVTVGAALLIGLLVPAGRRALASVTLNYFRATWQPDLETVVIEWQTATELNTVGFIVERSTQPDTGFAAITEVIAAVGDQLSGWTYDPVADDSLDLVLGTTYWYRLIVINSSPPNDVIDPVAVKVGEENTLTPTSSPTATATRTPTATPTRTRTPGGPTSTPTPTPTSTPTAQTSTTGPVVTPSVTFVSISGATVTPRPNRPVATTGVGAVATTIHTATPNNRFVATSLPVSASPLATPDVLAPIAQPPTNVPPTATARPAPVPTLAPTNATIVAIAPIVVVDDSTNPVATAPTEPNLSVLALMGAAGVLLLGGLYAILRQTSK